MSPNRLGTWALQLWMQHPGFATINFIQENNSAYYLMTRQRTLYLCLSSLLFLPCCCSFHRFFSLRCWLGSLLSFHSISLSWCGGCSWLICTRLSVTICSLRSLGFVILFILTPVPFIFTVWQIFITGYPLITSSYCNTTLPLGFFYPSKP